LGSIDYWHVGFSGLMEVVSSIWEPVLKPMSVGAIPLGITAGVIAYLVTRWAAAVFQVSRRRMLSEKAKMLKNAAISKVQGPETFDA